MVLQCFSSNADWSMGELRWMCHKHKSTTPKPINKQDVAVFFGFSALVFDSVFVFVFVLVVDGQFANGTGDDDMSGLNRGGGHPTQVCQRLCWWNKRCRNQM